MVEIPWLDVSRKGGFMPKQELISKYRKLVGIDENGDLSELKLKYSEFHERFNQGIRSEDPARVQKAQNNLVLLEQAYSVLAGDIRSREKAGYKQSTEDATSRKRLSIELENVRVGFQILHGEFFALETSSVETNILGMRTTKTNNRVKTSWPTGKLIIYNDHFKLKCIFGTYEVRYDDIDSVSKVWYLPFYLCMKQKSDETVRINVFGLGLGRKLKELAQQFTTQLRLDY